MKDCTKTEGLERRRWIEAILRIQKPFFNQVFGGLPGFSDISEGKAQKRRWGF